MPKLRCDVKNCIYNADACCCKSCIQVYGSKAYSSKDVACGSFHMRKTANDEIYNTEFATLDGTNQYVSIECDSLNCKYNKSAICASPKVKIGGGRVNRYDETTCETFEEI